VRERGDGGREVEGGTRQVEGVEARREAGEVQVQGHGSSVTDEHRLEDAVAPEESRVVGRDGTGVGRDEAAVEPGLEWSGHARIVPEAGAMGNVGGREASRGDCVRMCLRR
jgi:hypothetical protein